MSKLAVCDPATPAGIAQLKASAENTLRLIERRELATTEDVAWGDKALALVAKMTKQIDASRKARTAPIRAQEKEINAEYKPTLSVLEACDKALRAKINAAREASRQEQIRALVAVADAGGNVGGDTLVAAAAPTVELSEGLTEVSWLEWTVEDESLVPAEFKRTCAELVDAELERTKGGAKIPGIRVERKYDLKRKGVVER